MEQPPSNFLDLWRSDTIREQLFAHADTSTLCALRSSSTELCALLTPALFTRTHLTFTPGCLSKPSRLDALSRIGHHIKHFTFSMPHTPGTFLPPLLNPHTGQEIHFLYTPHTSPADVSARPRYGNSELGEYLTAQYPPIFHAATNVPSFIKALGCMPNLKHLRVHTPDQEPGQRYRRSAVDYALISLRIAVERAELHRLKGLTLAVHPGALLYLHPTSNYGASPGGLKRWRQIRSLKLSIDAWPFESSALDHLKLLLAYLRTMSGSVERLSFHWYGARGPCPLTLNLPPSRPGSASSSAKLFAEITSANSPLPATPTGPALTFPKLKRLNVRNTRVCAESLSVFCGGHAQTLKHMDLENVILTSGTWDEALEPLMRANGRDSGASWELRQSGSFEAYYLPQPNFASESSSSERGTSSNGNSGDGEEVVDELWPAIAGDYVDGDAQPRAFGGIDDDVLLEENVGLRDATSVYLRGSLATTPSNTHLHRKRRRRHHRRAPSPPPPLPTLKTQASRLFSKLREKQNGFFHKLMHQESLDGGFGKSRSRVGLTDERGQFYAPLDEDVPQLPLHGRSMPTLAEAKASVERFPYEPPVQRLPRRSSTPIVEEMEVVLEEREQHDDERQETRHQDEEEDEEVPWWDRPAIPEVAEDPLAPRGLSPILPHTLASPSIYDDLSSPVPNLSTVEPPVLLKPAIYAPPKRQVTPKKAKAFQAKVEDCPESPAAKHRVASPILLQPTVFTPPSSRDGSPTTNTNHPTIPPTQPKPKPQPQSHHYTLALDTPPLSPTTSIIDLPLLSRLTPPPSPQKPNVLRKPLPPPAPKTAHASRPPPPIRLERSISSPEPPCTPWPGATALVPPSSSSTHTHFASEQSRIPASAPLSAIPPPLRRARTDLSRHPHPVHHAHIGNTSVPVLGRTAKPLDPKIQGVQRDVEAEAYKARLAGDIPARDAALRTAKETVLARLNCRTAGTGTPRLVSISGADSTSGAEARRRRARRGNKTIEEETRRELWGSDGLGEGALGCGDIGVGDERGTVVGSWMGMGGRGRGRGRVDGGGRDEEVPLMIFR
jgi:hypothetical protein